MAEKQPELVLLLLCHHQEELHEQRLKLPRVKLPRHTFNYTQYKANQI